MSLNFGQKTNRRQREVASVSYPNCRLPKKKDLTRIFSQNLATQLKKNTFALSVAGFSGIFSSQEFAWKNQNFLFPLDEFVRIMNEKEIEIIAVIGNGYYRFLPERLDIDNASVYISRLITKHQEK